jgi:hypothetical protein
VGKAEDEEESINGFPCFDAADAGFARAGRYGLNRYRNRIRIIMASA